MEIELNFKHVYVDEEKRLDAIKFRYVFFSKKCCHCGKRYRLKKMWQVYRYYINASCHKWYYCTNCMHSKEEVLNEIDTDSCVFGIFCVDDFFGYNKKDYTKVKEQYIEE